MYETLYNVLRLPRYLCRDAMLLVDIDDLLYLLVAAQEDPAPVMDVFRNNIDHTSHLAIDCLAASYEPSQQYS